LISDKKDPFQTWWNERYFHSTSPFYESFRKLHKLGADLDYVNGLLDFLRLGDLITKAARESAAKKKNSVTLNRRFVEALKIYGTIVVGYTLVELKDHLNKATISQILEDKKKIADNAWNSVADILINFTKNRKSIEPRKQKLSDETRRALLDLPIFPLIATLRQDLPTKGNQPDPWGTLFLLAVTEHLREKDGKAHYLDAMRLLKRARRDRPFKAARQDAQTAIVRVRRFKIANPDWEKILNLLTNQSSRSRSSLSTFAPESPLS